MINGPPSPVNTSTSAISINTPQPLIHVPRRQGGAAADAGEDALLLGRALGHLEGLLLADLDHAVQQARVEVLGDEARADLDARFVGGVGSSEDHEIGPALNYTHVKTHVPPGSDAGRGCRR